MCRYRTARKVCPQSRLCDYCGTPFRQTRTRDKYCTVSCGRLGKVRQTAGQLWQFRCGHTAKLPDEGESTALVKWRQHTNTYRGGCWVCRVCTNDHLRLRSAGSESLSRLKKVINTSHHRAKVRGIAPMLCSPQDILAQWRKQKNRCASCCRKIVFKGKQTHIDHCHKTGKLRGIICRSCNWFEGTVKDLTTRQLNTMIAYIRKHRR